MTSPSAFKNINAPRPIDANGATAADSRPGDVPVGRAGSPAHAVAEKGFTFFGVLMIVLSLSAFTAGLFITLVPSESTRQADVTFQRADALQSALRSYKGHHAGAAPATLTNLITPNAPACTADTNSASATYRQLQGWCGPYLHQYVAQSPDEFRTDGWGTVFQYNTTVLRSCGPDLTCGNGDDLTFTGF